MLYKKCYHLDLLYLLYTILIEYEHVMFLEALSLWFEFPKEIKLLNKQWEACSKTCYLVVVNHPVALGVVTDDFRIFIPTNWANIPTNWAIQPEAGAIYHLWKTRKSRPPCTQI